MPRSQWHYSRFSAFSISSTQGCPCVDALCSPCWRTLEEITPCLLVTCWPSSSSAHASPSKIQADVLRPDEGATCFCTALHSFLFRRISVYFDSVRMKHFQARRIWKLYFVQVLLHHPPHRPILQWNGMASSHSVVRIWPPATHTRTRIHTPIFSSVIPVGS
ncbi:hypothetical protein LZ32DRAFT_455986 [Colletotrichum eremochloae]|nr:hypothetical protein LZ32DRAFT_455986 [Colletotrichum eremochloae]